LRYRAAQNVPPNGQLAAGALTTVEWDCRIGHGRAPATSHPLYVLYGEPLMKCPGGTCDLRLSAAPADGGSPPADTFASLVPQVRRRPPSAPSSPRPPRPPPPPPPPVPPVPPVLRSRRAAPRRASPRRGHGVAPAQFACCAARGTETMQVAAHPRAARRRCAGAPRLPLA
jgi:hypothetical protein